MQTIDGFAVRHPGPGDAGYDQARALFSVLGDDGGAERHALDDAFAVNDRLGSRPFAAVARYTPSSVLGRRGRR